MRDLYGRLIDGSLGATGRLTHRRRRRRDAVAGSAADREAGRLLLRHRQVGADGKATVDFDIPQFNGTVRVMAVAWTKEAVGHAATDVIVRDPVVVTASLPRFLDAGDKSRLLVEIANVAGAGRRLHARRSSGDGIGIAPEDPTRQAQRSRASAQRSTVPIIGKTPATSRSPSPRLAGRRGLAEGSSPCASRAPGSPVDAAATSSPSTAAAS